MNTQSRCFRLWASVLVACFLSSCAATRTETDTARVKSVLLPGRTCVLRTSTDTASVIINSTGSEGIVVDRIVMVNEHGVSVPVPPQLLETQQNNVIVDMTPAYTLAPDQSGLLIPFSEISRVHTEEFDTWNTVLATGLALVATAGLLYLWLLYELTTNGW